MVRLLIDGVAATPAVGVKIGIEGATPVSSGGAGRDVEIVLPSTRQNRAAVGDVAGMLSAVRFNDRAHEGILEQDGCVVARGALRLSSVEREASGRALYRMVLRVGGVGWVSSLASVTLAKTPVEFETVIGGQAIRDSWTWDKPVRFFPVQRDAQMVENPSSSVIPASRVLGLRDYHPFLHIGSIVRAAFAQAGYGVVSRFLNGAFFDTLYMSGRYGGRDISALASKIDFRAGRFADKEAVGDRYGKVEADPLSNTTASVGNIVDTADSSQTQDGVKAEGVFDNGGVFRKVGGRVAFVPSSEVMVGFEYYLKYKTSYKILSRVELSGFNSVFLGQGSVQSFRIVNPFADMKNNVVPGKLHRVVVFEHVEGTTYQLRYQRVLGPSQTQNMTYGTFSARTLSVTFPAGYPVVDPEIWFRPSGASTYSLYGGDWALYEGYVTETGITEVEARLQSVPGKVTPSAPKFFDDIYFGGAWEGAYFTLCKETYLTPVLSGGPAAGAVMAFADVAAHEVSQLDLLEAVSHMFNLRFITDEALREVHIEPDGGFDGESCDWSGRTDYSGKITIRETGAGFSSVMQVGYRRGDDSVAAYDASCGGSMGLCSWDIAGASEGMQTSRNKFFTPGVSLAGGYTDAPCSLWLQVGERGPSTSAAVDSFDFLPKVVRYAGMAALPAGQLWGWPSYSGEYPLAGFHCPGEGGFSLCFEDRDSIAGLHGFYDAQFERASWGRRITLSLRLGAADFESLVSPGTGAAHIGGEFLVGVWYEKLRCRLESVEGYDPVAGGSCKCTFLLL